MPELESTVRTDTGQQSSLSTTLALITQLVRDYQLADLQPTLDAAQRLTRNDYLNVAVFGRFKAGKSSFLNDLLGRPLLPIGVVPVTSVVTEIAYGPREFGQVLYQNGRRPEEVPLQTIGSFISESTNPNNALAVDRVRAFLPEMARYRALRLVDTPGLESTLLHNTEASLSWCPNTDMALIAVAVDPPLTQHDLVLIERMLRFTPNVGVLLTKMDLLDSTGQSEILAFVEAQLRKNFEDAVRLFPYSIKPAQNHREPSVKRWLVELQGSALEARSAALTQKLSTLLNSTCAYLQLALKSAEASDADRDILRAAVLGSGQPRADLHLEIQLVAARSAGATRARIEQHFRSKVFSPLCRTLAGRFAADFPGWGGSCASVLRNFREWLSRELHSELAAVSTRDSNVFLQPLRDAQRVMQSLIQSFRDRLAGEVQRVFGIALSIAETELDVTPPGNPDVSIGKVFNHEWFWLFSFVPASLVRHALERILRERIESELEKNLSRLTTQWEDAIRGAIRLSERQAHRRVDDLVATVQHLLSTDASRSAESIQADLRRLHIEINRLAH